MFVVASLRVHGSTLLLYMWVKTLVNLVKRTSFANILPS